MEVVGLSCSLSTGLRCSWGAEAKETNCKARRESPEKGEQDTGVNKRAHRAGLAHEPTHTLAPNRMNSKLLKQYTAMLTWTHRPSVLRLAWDSRQNKLLYRYSYRFLFERCSVRILAWIPAILSKVLRSFPQYLYTNAGIVRQLNHKRLFLNDL
jgi:hypothetical protein